MLVQAHVTIAASQEAVWTILTDIANSARVIRGIQGIEVVEQPPSGWVGLRWKETRLLFGEAATVEKCVTEALELTSFTTRAEDGGFVFLTTHRITEAADGVTLTGIHETRPQGFVARVKMLPMVFLKGVIRREILKDLSDIKTAVEGTGRRDERTTANDSRA